MKVQHTYTGNNEQLSTILNSIRDAVIAADQKELITLYKMMEEQLNQTVSELRHQVQLVQTVFDNMYDGIAVLDLTGQILFTNPSMQRIFGSEPPDTSPNEWSETYGIFYPDKETPVPLDLLLSTHFSRGEAIRDQELFVRNKEQPEGIHIRASAIPLFDENQEVIACAFFIRDILPAGLEVTYFFGEIVGKNQIMQEIFVLMQRAASSDITVLISGEYNGPQYSGHELSKI